MREIPIDIHVDTVTGVLRNTKLFSGLGESQLREVAAAGTMLELKAGEPLVEIDAESDGFFVILRGEARVLVRKPTAVEDLVDVARLGVGECIGEIGVLLDEPRSARVLASGGTLVVMRFESEVVFAMFRRIPDFGVTVARSLAQRLRARTGTEVRESDVDIAQIQPAAQALVPTDFAIRWRVLPVRIEGNVLQLGFVDPPDPSLISRVQNMVPGVAISAVRIDAAFFNQAIFAREEQLGTTGAYDATPATGKPSPREITLEKLLRRMAALGASDLHLSAGHRPRLRVDGEINDMEHTTPVTDDDVVELLSDSLTEHHQAEFGRANDVDYGWMLKGVARYRINLFRTREGASAVVRQIPERIMTAEQLGLPEIVKRFGDLPNGLVLVTGPTGSGKSTTLAAMVDHINKTRAVHVLTLEDPIEFVHQSDKALVNHREVGAHTASFARALKAALREDPDIILVGEMRDRETIALALETANTGHLVFGTLHTSTAISSIDRVVGVFPSDEQDQIRSTLADCLRGVIAQTLCRRIGGGRIAAHDILVCNPAIRNLIRRREPHKIASAMQTGAHSGNRLLNHDLARLVSEGLVEADEALRRAADRDELATRLGVKNDGRRTSGLGV